MTVYQFYNNSPWIAKENLMELLSKLPDGYSIHPEGNDLLINDIREGNNDFVGYIEILDGNGRIHISKKAYGWNEGVDV
jgi:hypothetical protein